MSRAEDAVGLGAALGQGSLLEREFDEDFGRWAGFRAAQVGRVAFQAARVVAERNRGSRDKASGWF